MCYIVIIFILSVIPIYRKYYINYFRGANWLGIGTNIEGSWKYAGNGIQMGDITEDTRKLLFDSSDYVDMSLFGSWNSSIELSDDYNVTGLISDILFHVLFSFIKLII